MISIIYKEKNNNTTYLRVSGHANYNEYGKDIICASVSSIVYTTLNAMVMLDANAFNAQEEKNAIFIEILEIDSDVEKILKNCINMLNELALKYSKNIKIRKED